MPARVAIVANPTSGRGKGAVVIPRVADLLASLGVEHSLLSCSTPDDPERLAREAAQGGAEIVAALGGDGQVGAVANGILASGTEAALAVIPAGTGNDFARALGLDRRDPLAAARLLAEPRIRRIDAARVEAGGGRGYFVNVGSAGFDAEVNAYANGLRWLKGTPSYVVAVFVMLARFRPGAFDVRVDDEDHRLEAMLVAVGNGVSYGGGMKVTPNARLDDGLLDVCVVQAIPKPEFVRTFPKVFAGRHVGHRAVRMLRGRRVEIGADREFQVFADGERVGTLPATFTALPAALPAVLPPDRDAGRG